MNLVLRSSYLTSVHVESHFLIRANVNNLHTSMQDCIVHVWVNLPTKWQTLDIDN